MIVATRPTNDRTTPIYVTTSSVVRSSLDIGGILSEVLADISCDNEDTQKSIH